MGVFNEQTHNTYGKGIQGAPGVGFNLTADGNYDMINRKLTNVGAPTANADAATKKYVDDNSSSSTSDLTVDSNIDMKDRYRILNLKSPNDADEPATKQYSDSKFLDKYGGTLLGNLGMNNKKITDVASPTNNKDAVTKEYSDNKFLAKSGGIMTGNIDMDRQYRIFNLPAPNGNGQPVNLGTADFIYLPRNGSKVMLNNLNMDNKLINHLGTPRADDDAATKKYVDDNSGSPDLSDYLEKDGTVAMTGNLNINSNKIIKLSTPTVNDDAATKKYVDDSVPDLSGYLKKDGTVAMTGGLNMNSNKINNLANPTSDKDAVNKTYADHLVHHTAIQPSHYTDQFSYLMSSASQWTDESNGGNSFLIDKIDDLSPSNGNPHTYNHKVIYYSINKNSQGGYKYKIGINFYRLQNNTDYTLCLEFYNTEYLLWHKTKITVDKGSSTGLTLNRVTIKKLSHKYSSNFLYYYRVIINFRKLSFGRFFLYTTIDIPQSGIDLNVYPSKFLGNYLVAYGIVGTVSDIDPDKVYDYHTAFDIKPTEVSYNVKINANQKEIKNVKLNRQIDDSVATVGLVKELTPYTKDALYRLYFDDVFDFSNADSYKVNPSASGIVFNKLKSSSGRELQIPDKTIDNIRKEGLNVNNYTLSFSPNLTNTFTLCIIFYHWRNRDFDIYNKDNNGRIFLHLEYSNILNQLIINVLGSVAKLTMLSSFSGKKNVLWLTQSLNNNLTRVKINNYNSLLSLSRVGNISFPATQQKIEFTTQDGVLCKIMFSPNFYNTDNEIYHKVMLQEKIDGSYIV